MRGKISRAAAALGIALALALVGAAGEVRITGQLLSYQDGFVFFTTGDGFAYRPTWRFTMRAAARRRYSRGPGSGARRVRRAGRRHRTRPLAQDPAAEDDYALARSTPSRSRVDSQSRTRPAGGDDAPYPDPRDRPAGSRAVHRRGSAGNAAKRERLHHDGRQRMEPAGHRDGSHRRLALSRDAPPELGDGLLYLYTRGSSQTLERGENGLSRPRARSASPMRMRVRSATRLLVDGSSLGRKHLATLHAADALQSGSVPEPSARLPDAASVAG